MEEVSIQAMLGEIEQRDSVQFQYWQRLQCVCHCCQLSRVWALLDLAPSVTEKVFSLSFSYLSGCF
jgi:hypothetical protein